MADSIKIGNLDISSFKVGSGDCTIYLGDTLLYQPIPPEIKWTAIYVGGTTSSAECDSSSTIVEREIATSNLASVEIGSCVTSIGESAFMNCGSITSITIPDSVTTIGVYAFLNDSSLTTIDIPSGITSIGEAAFLNCGGLTDITVNATTPPTLGNIVFANTNNCPIYVPAELVETYKSSWSQYASRIQAIPSLQWVTFSNGDTIPSDLQIYGIRGNAANIADTFVSYDEDIIAQLNRNKVDFYFGERSGSTCYSEQVLATDNVEYIFGNISCSDYFNMSTSVSVSFSTFQLYIYA